MRETIGGTWTFQIVIVFILFFVAFITLTINYTRAFRVKNEIINIIEREEGFTPNYNGKDPDPGARYLISAYLSQNGYDTKGKCDKGWYGVTSININDADKDSFVEKVDENHVNTKYYYCIQKVKNPLKGISASDIDKYNYKNRAYYKIKVFFHFSLPVVGDITTFSVKGETIDVYFNSDGLKSVDK